MNSALTAAPLLALTAAPLFISLINRTKAVLAGRQGAPLLQTYSDLWKLLHKGAVYSNISSWVFQVAPVLNLTSLLLAALMVPLGPLPAAVSFPGDFVLIAYLMGLARFCTVLAALDTGSSFEGMGASREVFFSALAEPALFMGLAMLSRLTGHLSLSDILQTITASHWLHNAPSLLLVLVAFFIIFLAENSRIPVDDPTTHLELTMIHEVMILDNSGPDLGLIEYGVALKIWLMGAIITGVIVPTGLNTWISMAASLAILCTLAILVGVVESSMARLRLVRVPQLLISAWVFTGLALFIHFFA